MKVELPNVRKIIIPDEGFTLVDADLSGADAQVVAAEADDKDLLTAFKAGVKIHEKNAEDMWGSRWTAASGTNDSGDRGKLYRDLKQGVHATNYGARARTVAVTLGWTVIEAERFQNRWFSLHPGIREWHRRIERQIATLRQVANRWGFRWHIFDRPSAVLPEALAWIPQSTVAINTIMGAKRACEVSPLLGSVDATGVHPTENWKLQVHDSLVFQLPTAQVEAELPRVISALHVPVPYPDPLIIPWGVKTSTKSWGDCN